MYVHTVHPFKVHFYKPLSTECPSDGRLSTFETFSLSVDQLRCTVPAVGSGPSPSEWSGQRRPYTREEAADGC